MPKIGVAASLAANVAAAGPDVVSRIVAAWPPLSFATSFELVLRLVRSTAATPGGAPPGEPCDHLVEPWWTEPGRGRVALRGLGDLPLGRHRYRPPRPAWWRWRTAVLASWTCFTALAVFNASAVTARWHPH